MDQKLSPEKNIVWSYKHSLITRFAWVPIPFFLICIVLFRIINPGVYFYSPVLLVVLNLTLSTLASVFIAYLLARSYLSSGNAGLLLMGCAVIIWGFAGLTGSIAGGKDPAIVVTIHNLCVWISSLIYLAGVIHSIRAVMPRSTGPISLAAGYLLALVIVIVIMILTIRGVVPVLFVQGTGGTMLRLIILSTATGMFLLSGAILLGRGSVHITRFRYWYALALILIATGLFGVMLQSSLGSLQNWAGLIPQFLAGVYMVVAAIYPIRDPKGWNISLEDALQESEDRYRNLVNTSPAAILVHSEGIIRFVNPSGLKLFGANRESELLGKPILSLVAPEFRDIAVKRIKQAESIQTPLLEMKYVRLDGTVFDGEATGKTVNFQGIPGIQVIIYDISERKKAYQQIIRHAHLFNNISDAVIVSDREFRITFWNRAAEKLYGWSAEEALGKSGPDLLQSRFIGMSRKEAIDSADETGESRIEVIHFDRQGNEHHVDSFFRVSKDDQGNIIEYISVNRDITDQVRLVEKLEQLNKRFEIAQRASGIGTWDWDVVAGTIEWSTVMYELFGLDPAKTNASFELWRSIVHPEDRDAASDNIDHALKTHSLLNNIYRVVHPDGKICWINALGKGEYDGNDNPIRMMGICQDISDRKQMEMVQHNQREELRRLNLELDFHVRQRTEELQNVIRELEEYNYSIAHDLRAPLRHLSGYVGLISKNQGNIPEDKLRKYMGIISDSAIQMGVLIDSILTFSKISRTQIAKQKVNMVKLTETAIKTLQGESKCKELRWNVRPMPDVYGDPVLLSIVMSNLLSNAIKFTSRKDKAVIEIGHIDQHPAEDVIYVKDNGVGFDMKYSAKLFKLFERLHSAGEFEGTGLGLANIRRIIERHGGRAWAIGEENKGATFYFALPKEN